MIRYLAGILLSFLWFMVPYSIFGASEVIQIGVATPQNEMEKNNVEKLRKRAVSNAMDLSILQIAGATVSSERKDSIRSREDITIRNDKVENKIDQQSRFSTGGTTRSEGHAQLVEIVREWQENGSYYVEAKISVDSQEETENRKNCGDYWLRAGKPAISISFIEVFNDLQNDKFQGSTLRYFRDNLSHNGVMVSTTRDGSVQYLIKVLQSIKAKEQAEFGTVTMHCRLSFQIIDLAQNETVAEYSASHGPQAGFTAEQAKESCLQAIAPKVSENLIRTLAKIMNDRWNNGVEQQVIISGMPDHLVNAASETLQNLYQVTSSTPAVYTDGNYRIKLRFKGSAADLSQVIQTAFADEDWNIIVTLIQHGKIYLTWTDRSYIKRGK